MFGYLGASVCGVATGMLADHRGWDGVLWFYGASAVIGAGLLAMTWRTRTPERHRVYRFDIRLQHDGVHEETVFLSFP